MSDDHIEWGSAKDTYVELLQEGQEFGEDTVQEDNLAVIFEYDSSDFFVIEGTEEEMRDLMNRIGKVVFGRAWNDLTP